MGARTITLFLSFFLGAVSVYGGISFHPHDSQFTLEGIILKRLAFFDGGGKEVTCQLPPSWDYSGAGNRLILYPKGKSQAEAVINTVNLDGSSNFDEENSKKLVAEVIDSRPKDSAEFKVISQGKDSLKISGKETFHVLISYKLLGQTFNRSILFLNRQHEQLRFQLTAREGDFQELQRVFQASLCTWQNL